MRLFKVTKFKFFLICFFAFFSIVTGREAIAGDYYASPNGSGTECSFSNPCKIDSFWGKEKPGDTLYLLDGVYKNDDSMIAPPYDFNFTTQQCNSYRGGIEGSPFTLKALNDGKATIDGEGVRTPVKLRCAQYMVIEGINAHSSPENVVTLSSSNNNIVRRVIAWDARSDDNYMVFASNYGNDNLFEDVAGWGSGRKIFQGYKDTRTTWRRCFFRWTYHTDTVAFWKLGMSLSYWSKETTIENCIGTWDELPGTYAPQRHAIFGMDPSSSNGNHKMFGNIGYHLSTQNGPPSFIFSTIGFPSNFIMKDSVGYTDRTDNIAVFGLDSETSYSASNLTSIGGSGLGETYFPYSFYAQNQAGTINNIIIQNARRNATNTGTGYDYVKYWNNENHYTSASPVNYAIKNPALTSGGGNILQVGLDEIQRPKVNGQYVGAQIQYRYVNGELTGELLWPWPMESRIKEAMIASGYSRKGGLDGKGGLDLTKIIFELGGGTMPSFDSQPLAYSAIPSPPSGLKFLTNSSLR